MMTSWPAKNIFLLLYFIAVLLFLFVSLRTWVYVYDEGFAVLNGERILRGEIPYRDFWTVYPSGQSWVLAAVFGVFGTSLGAARVYDTLVRFALVVGVYFIGTKIAPRPAVLVASAVVALWLGTILFYAYAVLPALMLALLAIRCLIEYAATDRQMWLAIGGVLIGLVSLFRLDFAAYLGIAITVSLSLLALSKAVNNAARAQANRRFGARVLLAGRLELALIGAAAVVALPVYIGMIAICGFTPVWQQLVVFPLTVLRNVRHLPYPQFAPDFALFFKQSSEYNQWARFYLPLFIGSISLLVIGISVFKGRLADGHSRVKQVGGVAVTAFGLLVFAQALSRYDWVHVLPASVMAVLALGFLLGQAPRSLWRRWPVAVILVALLGMILFSYTRPSLDDLSNIIRYASPFQCHSRTERARCIAVSSDQEKAVAFIRAHTGPDDPIFVGNARHDLIFINDVAFYFLAGRPCPTAYHELHPGVATTLTVQQEIARDIERQQVEWIVLVQWPVPSEPNDSSVSSGVRYLDDWIRAHYVPVREFGEYTVWNVR